MKRVDFIKRSAIAGFSLILIEKATANTSSCKPTPGETEGPFSTHNPSSLVKQNITAGRLGIPLLINITVNDINNECRGIKNAIVDIWHCDSKGEYSEYGGKDEHGKMGMPGGMHMPPPDHPFPSDSLRKGNEAGRPPMGGGRPFMGGGSMQAADHVKEHFLRGRQQANSNGQVSFHSIYPGWYAGRAPHIHVHIYSFSGQSLLVTQIALPEEISKVVYTKGVYAPHGQAETTNAADMVFSDSIVSEMATISGNSTAGYTLSHSVYIKA